MFKALPPKVKLIVIGGIILLFAIIIFIAWRAGKKKSETTVNLTTGNADTGGALASEAEIKQLASQIHTDLAGVNFYASHNSELYTNVLSLSDTDLTRLSNEFNLEFSKEGDGSLVDWVNAEYAVPLSQWAGTKGTLLSRFAKLNIH